MPRLLVEELEAGYGDHQTLYGVGFRVDPGERVALLGANGAGKTTLLYQLMALRESTAGAIRLDGVLRPAGASALSRWRRQIGLLFQDPDDQLFGPTVVDDVAIGPRNEGVASAEAHVRARATLRLLGIEDLADRPVHALSLGQRRAVALAGVLVLEPSVLLLDEPTQGLDAATEDALLTAIEVARTRGVSIVMATHDVDLVCRWADRVVVLDRGRVAGDGRPQDVLVESLLAQARLRRPWILEVGRALVAAGVLPSTDDLPLSGQALVDAVDRISGPLARAASRVRAVGSSAR